MSYCLDLILNRHLSATFGKTDFQKVACSCLSKILINLTPPHYLQAAKMRLRALLDARQRSIQNYRWEIALRCFLMLSLMLMRLESPIESTLSNRIRNPNFDRRISSIQYKSLKSETTKSDSI